MLRTWTDPSTLTVSNTAWNGRAALVPIVTTRPVAESMVNAPLVGAVKNGGGTTAPVLFRTEMGTTKVSWGSITICGRSSARSSGRVTTARPDPDAPPVAGGA